MDDLFGVTEIAKQMLDEERHTYPAADISEKQTPTTQTTTAANKTGASLQSMLNTSRKFNCLVIPTRVARIGYMG